MGAQSNLAPIIIKRKKIIAAGHHGGAWKVAYADFVTAMMAFFMMMWLLNATTEKQRSGLADYFSPSVAISQISGGGDGAFGGESIFSEETLPQNGTGASSTFATQADQARGDSGTDEQGSAFDQIRADLEAIASELIGRGGESTVMENLLQHVVTRITDEGLIIELFARDGAPLFEGDGARPTQLMKDLISLVSEVSGAVANGIAIGAHLRAKPVVLINNPVWSLSGDRATSTRELLESSGIRPARIQRVTGHADREPAIKNTMDVRNDRVEIVLLRSIMAEQ